jgi:hypothetical protein
MVEQGLLASKKELLRKRSEKNTHLKKLIGVKIGYGER